MACAQWFEVTFGEVSVAKLCASLQPVLAQFEVNSLAFTKTKVRVSLHKYIDKGQPITFEALRLESCGLVVSRSLKVYIVGTVSP